MSAAEDYAEELRQKYGLPIGFEIEISSLIIKQSLNKKSRDRDNDRAKTKRGLAKVKKHLSLLAQAYMSLADSDSSMEFYSELELISTLEEEQVDRERAFKEQVGETNQIKKGVAKIFDSYGLTYNGNEGSQGYKMVKCFREDAGINKPFDGRLGK